MAWAWMDVMDALLKIGKDGNPAEIKKILDRPYTADYYFSDYSSPAQWMEDLNISIEDLFKYHMDIDCEFILSVLGSGEACLESTYMFNRLHDMDEDQFMNMVKDLEKAGYRWANDGSRDIFHECKRAIAAIEFINAIESKSETRS